MVGSLSISEVKQYIARFSFTHIFDSNLYRMNGYFTESGIARELAGTSKARTSRSGYTTSASNSEIDSDPLPDKGITNTSTSVPAFNSNPDNAGNNSINPNQAGNLHPDKGIVNASTSVPAFNGIPDNAGNNSMNPNQVGNLHPDNDARNNRTDPRNQGLCQ